MLTSCRNWYMTPSVSRVPGNCCSGLLGPSVGRMAYGTSKFNQRTINTNSCLFQRTLPGGIIWKSPATNCRVRHVSSAGRDGFWSSYADNMHKGPLWVFLLKQVIWRLRSLLEFLVEQPSQLRHLEWPSFQSTLKTATLTLVLVALLIVALASVDSVLCYLLALFLRRTA
ncbi:hypothetical protein LINPERPRIM_LOCUS15988 [Linum perenne]